jgi:hypothetical protein
MREIAEVVLLRDELKQARPGGEKKSAKASV